MLRVSIELVPGGNDSGRHEVAALAIARVADAADGHSLYAALVRRASGPCLGGQVAHLPRHGPLELVRRVLDVAATDGLVDVPIDARTHLAKLAQLRTPP